MTDELGRRKPPYSLRAWRCTLRRKRNHVNPRYSREALDEAYTRWGFVALTNTAMTEMWEEFPESDGP